ncbi:hypothetical protein SRIMM317S_06562 [Streptomyces rimosus subsp. rimosus]
MRRTSRWGRERPARADWVRSPSCGRFCQWADPGSSRSSCSSSRDHRGCCSKCRPRCSVVLPVKPGRNWVNRCPRRRAFSHRALLEGRALMRGLEIDPQERQDARKLRDMNALPRSRRSFRGRSHGATAARSRRSSRGHSRRCGSTERDIRRASTQPGRIVRGVTGEPAAHWRRPPSSWAAAPPRSPSWSRRRPCRSARRCRPLRRPGEPARPAGWSRSASPRPARNAGNSPNGAVAPSARDLPVSPSRWCGCQW